MARYIYKWSALTIVATCLGFASCATDSQYESEKTQVNFDKMLDGTVSPQQWWKTAVTLNLNVTTPDSVKLWLMSGNDKGTLFDYKEIETSARIQMIAPQGKGNTLYLVSVCNRQKDVKEITLTGKTKENVDVSIELKPKGDGEFSTYSNKSNVKPTDNQVTVSQVASYATKADASLYGSSIAGNAKYNELTTDQLSEAFTILNRAYQEYIPAKSLGANCDYELKSNGDFNITWFAGNCQSSSSHTLGYYYHTPGTYNDIKYVDLSETEMYDYIDGLAKVQYKVNDVAAEQYGVLANHWYDANFDMGDLFDKQQPYISARKGDEAYNTMAVFSRYGRNITKLRGVSFTIDVPAGMYVGFYDRVENHPQPEQYDRFVKMGIKPYTSREKFKAMNFSCEAMNMNINGPYRSCVLKTAHALWLGMENDYTGGDLDCNDVIFEVSADLEIHHPSVVEPDLKPFGEYDNVMPWTIAFEDLGRNADFDFNDAVIQLFPNPEKEECCVTVKAAGSNSHMYLHYDGPDGDVNLGEIHELLGGNSSEYINTKTTIPELPSVQIDCVKWPNGYTMRQDARRFYIEVKRGDCADCNDVITLAEEPGKMPEALLIAGEWKWPKEGVNIMKAYPSFKQWAKDNTDMKYWNWYANPNIDMVVGQ